MSLIHVLGIGSPFGDDRLGWEVVHHLQKLASIRSLHPDLLKITACDRPGIHLLELMKPAKTVFLIDAIKSGADEGFIRCFKNSEIEHFTSLISSHEMGIAQALKIGKTLNELPENIVMYGIEINTSPCKNNIADVISNPVKKSITKLVVTLEQNIFRLVYKTIYK